MGAHAIHRVTRRDSSLERDSYDKQTSCTFCTCKVGVRTPSHSRNISNPIEAT